MKVIRFLRGNIENIVAIVICAVITFFFTLKSQLHPWIGSEALTDSSVFKTVSMMIEKGYMPYKDSFDHKGPMIYFINIIGDLIDDYQGVWYIEYIFIIVALFMMYKISRLSITIIPSIITVLISMNLLFVYYEGGNFTEVYALAFIAGSIFIFLDYIINEKVNKIRLIILGICFASTCLLRLNMIAAWVVFCLYIFIICIKNKDIKNILFFIKWFIVGVLIVILPTFLWLIRNKLLKAFWDVYIVFNSKYSSTNGGWGSESAVWNSYLFFFNTPVNIIAFIGLIYNINIQKKYSNLVYLIYMIINLGFISMSGLTYGHYGMVVIPSIIYPISLVFKRIEEIDDNKTAGAIKMIVGIFTVYSIIAPNWIDILSGLPNTYRNRYNNNIPDALQTITEMIETETDENESISVYGNWDVVYVLGKRKHATKYSFQFPIGQVDSSIMDEYFYQLSNEQPKVIVVQNGHWDQRIIDFATENNYRIGWKESYESYGELVDGAIVYVKN